MLPCFAVDPAGAPVVPIERIDEAGLAALDPLRARWAAANGFKATAGQILLCPDGEGAPSSVLFGLGKPSDRVAQPLLAGRLAALPPGFYRIADEGPDDARDLLAFGLGSYRFERYVKPKDAPPRLAVPAHVDRPALMRTLEAVWHVRDLVNTPANDLGTDELAAAVHALAGRFGVVAVEIAGEELRAGFPLVHAVGAGSDRPPRLVHFTWGESGAPKVTLVGKGVVFDTGGLNIKPDASMLLMKKDMGGAAHVLGLAEMIMDAGLGVSLTVVVPIVENAISGRAFRPGDVYRSRKGLTVEIGNTDAEGRLILADALAFADEGKPDLLVDMATLTGAARVALGPDLVPVYTRDDGFAADLAEASARTADPVWRLPLHPPYDGMLASKVADVNHITSGGFAGSITAALFLGRFVEAAGTWLHADIFAWTPTAKPGKPEGGEAQVIRALYDLLARRYPPT